MKKEDKVIIEIALSAIVIVLAIYFQPQPNIEIPEIVIIKEVKQEIVRKEIVLNIKDRTNGICADMYAEGFEWGFRQIPVQAWTWKLEGYSESSIKEMIYDIYIKEELEL